MRKKLLKNLDWGVLICAVILIAIGLTALFSTSQNTDHVEFIKQVQWLFISIPFFILAIVIDYDKILRIAPVFYGICVFLLILVLFTEQINGASSWFNIGSFSFQPSEFCKIATILFMTYALNLLQARNKKEIIKFYKLLAVLAIAGFGTTTTIPFAGKVDLGFFYYIIAAVAIVGIVNSVNLTDGIDGLDGSVTFFACVAFMLVACTKSYLGITAMSAAAAGACLGFLVWNFHPAKVFMGDTGSLFLGGLVCGLAFAVDMPILLLPVGIIYIVEELSVILQVSYFKITHGKRLFKMSPIHHHFEMCGWSEGKIGAVFSTVTAIFGAIAFALAYFGG